MTSSIPSRNHLGIHYAYNTPTHAQNEQEGDAELRQEYRQLRGRVEGRIQELEAGRDYAGRDYGGVRTQASIRLEERDGVGMGGREQGGQYGRGSGVAALVYGNMPGNMHPHGSQHTHPNRTPCKYCQMEE